MHWMNPKQNTGSESNNDIAFAEKHSQTKNQEAIGQVKNQVEKMIRPCIIARNSVVDSKAKHGERMVVSLYRRSENFSDVCQTPYENIVIGIITIIPINKTSSKSGHIGNKCEY